MNYVPQSLNNLRTVEESFNRDGFVHVERCLPSEELNVVRIQLERYRREIVPNLNPAEAFFEEQRQPDNLKQLQRMEQHDDCLLYTSDAADE